MRSLLNSRVTLDSQVHIEVEAREQGLARESVPERAQAREKG